MTGSAVHKTLVVLLTLFSLSYQQIPPSCDQPSIDVVYSVEFPDPICSNSSDLPDVTISVRRTDKVITVLEEASATDAIYQLQVIYFGSLGFSVNGIGGVEATFEVNGCFWGFYIERPDGQIIPPDVGVSTFSIPSDNYRVILRYTSLNPTLEPRNQEELKASTTFEMCQATIDAQINGTIPQPCIQPDVSVNYAIEFPDPICSNNPDINPVSLTLRQNDKVFSLMQIAANDIPGPTYQFQASFFGGGLGYSIEAIDGVEPNFEENGCFWAFFVERPDGQVVAPDVGVSTFSIPSNNYQVIWRLTSENIPLSPLTDAEMMAITTYNECQEELFGSENITTNGSATLTTAGVMVSLLIAVLGYILV